MAATNRDRLADLIREAIGSLTRDRTLRALTAALAITVAIALLTVLGRLAAGDDLKPALRAASALEARKLIGPSGLDSWGAMLSALHRQQAGGPVYAAAMLLDNCKYQYPPAALLLVEALPHPEGPHLCSRDAEAGAPAEHSEWTFKRWIDLASLAAVLTTLWLGFVLLRQGLAASASASASTSVSPSASACVPVSTSGTGPEPAPTPPSALRDDPQRWFAAALVAALGLSFFPLVWGHTLGQVQVPLNLAMTAALCAMLAGRKVLAGALLGLCCIFKPTYALFLVWAPLRREWRLAAALMLVAAAGHGLALARYGLAVHLEYLDFLRGLGRVGESYWANQSLTGLLHRWLDPASALQWADSAFGSSAHAQRPLPQFDWAAAGFPEEHAGVYVATVAFSLLLLGAAFWPARGSASNAPLPRTLDLGVAIAAITMASPIVWLHHYGIFFALFALALAAALRVPATGSRVARTSSTLLALLALAYALLGSVMLRPEAIFTSPALGLLGSQGWFGALLLVALLWRLRRDGAFGAEALPR